MNHHNIGSSSLLSHSSSSSSDDELEQLINECDVEHQLMGQHILNNNLIVAQLAEYQNATKIHGGSVLGHKVIHRDREAAAHRLFNDYFSENPTFNEGMFHRRFRMSRSLFFRIVDDVKNHNSFFKQRTDCTGRWGLSTLQKITAAFRILAYEVPADATDEYINIRESTAIKCVKKFCRAIVEIFSDQYLRSPNASNVARLLYIGKQRGFPGMLGSLDCIHWKWKNCPTGWAGSYAGRSGSPTIILEIVADYDLWIWHAFFGMPGSNNDINVLQRSHLFSDLARGITPPAHYVIQGKEYNVGYYLADGIYPKWSTLVQTFHEPRSVKKKFFAMRQESCRKDVERAFGVLQSRFAIVANPARYWQKKHLDNIMKACIIMHNMIVEDERDLSAPIEIAREVPIPDVETMPNETSHFQEFLGRYKKNQR
ncbi:uncharacterized protein LOC131008295 [Salvia miltiorrhiza]|uniref:uncharacterized protein LOC131008295 n=1 Tax=Salvia miltiorrhiza TaxID=226208 RepID=UPI0025AB756A|nr:uncharacterized protein LOC131008295 [Salvia miltiorrhiza]